MSESRFPNRKRRMLLLHRDGRPAAPELRRAILPDGTAAESSIIRTQSDLDVEEFVAACGAGSGLSLQVAVPDAEDEPVLFEAERPYVLIGRGADCDIRLPHEEVSYRHAYLQSVGGSVFCFDLASRSGTHSGSGPQRSWRLAAGDDLRIGPYRIRIGPDEFHDGFTDAPVLPAVESGESVGRSVPALEFVNASPRMAPWRVRHDVTLIGQNRVCKVRLTDESVSRVHCSLVRTPAGLWVIDLLGRGGTQVNGRPVALARVNTGDEFQVGRFRIRLNEAAPTVEQNGQATPAPEASLAALVHELSAMQRRMFDLCDRIESLEQSCDEHRRGEEIRNPKSEA